MEKEPEQVRTLEIALGTNHLKTYKNKRELNTNRLSVMSCTLLGGQMYSPSWQSERECRVA